MLQEKQRKEQIKEQYQLPYLTQSIQHIKQIYLNRPC